MKLLEPLPAHTHQQILDSSEAVAQAAAAYILRAAQHAISTRGAFKLVLAGGSTPLAAYRLLARAEANWQHWHIFFGDERCLAPEDTERNSQMARAAWLNDVAIPPEQIHTIEAQRGGENAAADYSRVVEAAVPFDLVILGMGEDGHTASLFPAHHHPDEAWVVAVTDAPKPPPERVSLTTRALTSTRALILLITGSAKHTAFMQWQQGESLPVARLLAMTDSHSHIELLLDSAAVHG